MRKIYVVVGGVLVVVGILGFAMPGPLFGVFDVNPFHNIVHLPSGVVTLIAATQGIGPMRTCGRILGFGYLAVAIAGFVWPDLLGLMHVRVPDNVLHLVLAAAFLYVGLVAPPRL